jgi:hypothetical protein
VTRGWRKLHNLYSLPGIVRMIRSRRMKWVRHAATWGDWKWVNSVGWKTRGDETTQKI